MKKRKIIINKSNSTPIEVIGIASFNKDYRISWEINNKLNISLVKIENYVVNNPKYGDKVFNIFSYIDKNEVSYLLIANKQNGKIISEKYKNIDYFIVISKNEESPKLTDVSKNLKESKLISGVFVLEAGKNIKKLIQSYIF